MPEGFDISLVIPAYNAEDYLEEAIRSALTQSMPAREIIVVDDGSTDRTADVAASFAVDVRLIRQENHGVSSARNMGIASANFPWLAFLDADDVMAPDRFAVQTQMLAANPTLEIVMGLQVLFWGKQWSPSAIENQLPRPGLIPSALTCRAATFSRAGLFDPGYRGPEFIAWLARATELEIPYSVVDQAVVYRRVHDRNLSRNLRSADDYPRLIKDLLDRRRSV